MTESKFKLDDTVYFFRNDACGATSVLKGKIIKHTIDIFDYSGKYNIMVERKGEHCQFFYSVDLWYISKNKQEAVEQWDKCVFQPAFKKLARLSILRKGHYEK